MDWKNKLIGSKDFDKILSIAEEHRCGIDVYEGCLQDNAIIYTWGQRLLRNSPKTKYIILKEHFINTWSSGIKLIFTDDSKKVYDFRNLFENDNE